MGGAAEWAAWFSLPYCSDAPRDARFRAYFTRAWTDALATDLTNLLTEVFGAVRPPAVLGFNMERVRRRTLELELEGMRSEVTRLKSMLELRAASTAGAVSLASERGGGEGGAAMRAFGGGGARASSLARMGEGSSGSLETPRGAQPSAGSDGGTKDSGNGTIAQSEARASGSGAKAPMHHHHRRRIVSLDGPDGSETPGTGSHAQPLTDEHVHTPAQPQRTSLVPMETRATPLPRGAPDGDSPRASSSSLDASLPSPVPFAVGSVDGAGGESTPQVSGTRTGTHAGAGADADAAFIASSLRDSPPETNVESLTSGETGHAEGGPNTSKDGGGSDEGSDASLLNHAVDESYHKFAPSASAAVPTYENVTVGEDGIVPEGLPDWVDSIPSDGVCFVRRSVFSGHSAAARCCRLSGGGAAAASASADKSARVWTIGDDSTDRNATIYCGADVLSLAWESSGDRLLLLGTAERSIKAWNADTRRIMGDLSVDAATPYVCDLHLSPSAAEPCFVSAACSLPGPTAMRSGRRGVVTLWSASTLKRLHTLPLGNDAPGVSSVRLSPVDGKLAAVASDDSLVRLFDASSRAFCGVLDCGAAGCTGSGVCVRFGESADVLHVLTTDGELLEWDVRMGSNVSTSVAGGVFDGGSASGAIGGGACVTSRALVAPLGCAMSSIDGTQRPPEMAWARGLDGGVSGAPLLLMTSRAACAPLVDARSGGARGALLDHAAGCTSVDWHHASALALSATADGRVVVSSPPAY